MSANASSLLTLNPIIVYATLGLYGLLFAFMFLYLHGRFRKASKVLGLITTHWAEAESKHTGFLANAQDQIARIGLRSTEVPAAKPVTSSLAPSITVDTRAQVVTMGRKGLTVDEISRSTGLPEGEVDVLLGLARMER